MFEKKFRKMLTFPHENVEVALNLMGIELIGKNK